MAKNNQEADAVLRSSGESDSDATSSSSEEEVLTQAPSLPTADKKSTAQKNPLDPAAEKAMDSGSESGDSDSPLKSIVSKSMDDGSKLKRPRSSPNSKPKSAVSPVKTPTKRLPVAEAGKDSKKPKTEKGGGGGEEEVKKSVLFQRLWSDDDEVAILKGMLDYTEKKGVDPMADANDFHDFIKESLHVDVDRKQVVDKVRRLKKRYMNSMGKRKTFSPHEQIVLDLSKQIWEHVIESTDLDQQNKSSMKTRTISKAAAVTKGGGKAEMKSPAKNRFPVTYGAKKEPENSGEGEKLVNSDQFIGRASISLGVDESIVTVGLELCGEDKKAEIEEKWIKLHLEESDLFLRKLDLARQESEMIIAALRSKGN